MLARALLKRPGMRTSGIFSLFSATLAFCVGCGGATETSDPAVELGPRPSPDVGGERDDGTYVLESRQARCDRVPTMTIENTEHLLPEPKAYDYVLHYEDGRTTKATLTIAPYFEVRCGKRPGPSTVAMPPIVHMVFKTVATLTTEDGGVAGDFQVRFTFRAYAVGDEPVDVELSALTARADRSRARGTVLKTTWPSPYDGYEVAIDGASTMGDNDRVKFDVMGELRVTEIAFTTAEHLPYAHLANPIGVLRPAED